MANALFSTSVIWTGEEGRRLREAVFLRFDDLIVQPNSQCGKRNILWSSYIFKIAPTMMFHFVLGLEWWPLSIPESFNVASGEKGKLVFWGHWLQPIQISQGSVCQLLLRWRKQWCMRMSLSTSLHQSSGVEGRQPGFCSRSNAASPSEVVRATFFHPPYVNALFSEWSY